MTVFPVWASHLTIRQKFRFLGAGLVLPFLFVLGVTALLHQSVTAEVLKTLELNRQGDEALVKGAKIDALLLIQTRLQALSQRASSASIGPTDSLLFEEAGALFASAEGEWEGLDPSMQALRQTWFRYRDGFLVELPALLTERFDSRQRFEDQFQTLQELTLYYQDRLDDQATRDLLLAQTRAFFGVLTVLHGREAPYLNERSLADWQQFRREWLARMPETGAYRSLALEYLRTIDRELAPTLEAWIRERNRVELGLLRHLSDQEKRASEVAAFLSTEKSRSLESIRVGLSERSQSQSTLQDQSLTWLVVLMVSGVLGGILLYTLLRMFERGLIVPLTRTTEWAHRILSGDYDARLTLNRNDEIGVLNRTLEHMALEVIRKSREIEEVNRGLELTVAQRTDHLAQALAHLEEAQAKLVLSEKLSLLGTLAASMAHELNTPLAAIVSAGNSLLKFLEEDLLTAQRRFDQFTGPEQNAVIRWVSRSIQNAEPVQRRRHSTIRELGASLEAQGVVAAEAQAEFWFELGLVDDAAQQKRWSLQPRINEMLHLSLEVVSLVRMTRVVCTAAQQAGRVVQSLQQYIQKGNQEAFTWFNLKESMVTCLELIGLRRLRDVEIRWSFAADFQVFGPMGTLIQIWLNLMNNALEAMAYHGALTLEAEPWKDGWRVGVRDTGPGIPAEIGERVFEPFFTSKKAQGGMGLGLDICRRELVALGGQLTFTSSPGDTAFSAYWPLLRERQV